MPHTNTPRLQPEIAAGAANTAGGGIQCIDPNPLRPFQGRFLKDALAPGIDTAALSIPRGNGKSWLAAHVLTRCLTPGDPLHQAAAEYLLCAASIEQARIVFRFVRAALEATGAYRFIDSHTRIGIAHKATNTRLRVLSSNGKTSMGIVGCPLLVADEPGSWETVGGQLMHDAIATAQGKPGSPLRAIFIGTLAPAAAGGWWPRLIRARIPRLDVRAGATGRPGHVGAVGTIRKANPLTAISAPFRAKLIEERDDARADERLRARFLSYRLNVPSGDPSSVLVPVEHWQRVEARPVPEPDGRPIVGVDLGGGRAWSAGVALWRNGRMDAFALAPGLPSLDAQEKRDLVPRGTYQALADAGTLTVDAGLHVQRVGPVAERIALWNPEAVICDRFRLGELADAMGNTVPLVPRVVRWSEAAEDIRALRKMAADGPLAVAPEARGLVAESLAVADVKTDDAGNVRMVKRGTNNAARDDVAAALALACGLVSRNPEKRTGPRHRVC